jgi:hypothetical protein
MNKLLLIFLVLYSSLALSETEDVCTRIAQKAERERALIPSYMSGRKVVDAGRLYFYSAPDKRCRMKNVFVIPNDHLEAYSTYGDYTEVVYWSAKSGDPSGWVLSSRIVETGTGIGPDRNQK